jgi:uncharacterized protein
MRFDDDAGLDTSEISDLRGADGGGIGVRVTLGGGGLGVVGVVVYFVLSERRGGSQQGAAA